MNVPTVDSSGNLTATGTISSPLLAINGNSIGNMFTTFHHVQSFVNARLSSYSITGADPNYLLKTGIVFTGEGITTLNGTRGIR